MTLPTAENASSLYTKLRSVVQMLRYSRPSHRLLYLGLASAALAVAIDTAGVGDLLVELFGVDELSSVARWVAITLYVLAGASVVGVFVLLWRQVLPPPEETRPAVPSALKGPLAFGPQDAELFRRLGREAEIGDLLGWVLDDQISLGVLMGESGAGKSSLLRSGLSGALGGQEPEIKFAYWEAKPDKPLDGLISAINGALAQDADKPAMGTLTDLYRLGERTGRLVVAIDQLEQLDRANEAHGAIFKLLKKVATEWKPPYRVTFVVAFRRDYDPAWRDFEIEELGPAKSIMLSLRHFTPDQARSIIATLAEAADVTLADALVDDLLADMKREDGRVSPVDIAITMLAIGERARDRPDRHLGRGDHRIGGGTTGLLAGYAESKLERYRPDERQAILRTMLALCDMGGTRRIAEGRSPAELSATVEVPREQLIRYLYDLASPQVRLLEKLPDGNVRLSHERFIPALHSLCGVMLAEAARAGLVFERAFSGWVLGERSRRLLLRGRRLRSILQYRDQLHWREHSEEKRSYLRKSVRARNRARAILGGGAIALVLATQQGWGWIERQQDRDYLRAQLLPAGLVDHNSRLEVLELRSDRLTRLDWLRGSYRELTIDVTGLTHLGLDVGSDQLSQLTLNLRGTDVSSLEGLSLPPELQTLTLNLMGTGVSGIEGLSLPLELHALTLNLGGTRVSGIEGLSLPPELHALTLDLWRTGVSGLEGLSLPPELLTLSLALGETSVSGLEGLSLPPKLKALMLDLGGADVLGLEGLSLPPELQTFTLDLQRTDVSGLEGLSLPPELQTLSLNLRGTGVSGLEGLSLPPKLQTLTLNLKGTDVSGLEGLSLPLELQTLTLNVGVSGLEGLSLPPKLQTLTLDLGETGVSGLEGLSLPPELQTLTLDLRETGVSSLEGLSLPPELQMLTLDLTGTGVSGLEGLSLPPELQTLTLDLTGTGVSGLEGLSLPPELLTLTLDLGRTGVSGLEGLSLPPELLTLTLDLWRTDVSGLEELSLPPELQTLTLALAGTRVSGLEGLSLPPELQTLTLDLYGTGVSGLEGLSLPPALLTLTLALGRTGVSGLEGLSLPPELLTLTLDLWRTDVSGLEELSLPPELQTLTLALGGTGVSGLEGLSLPPALTTVSLSLGESVLVSSLAWSAIDELDRLANLTIQCSRCGLVMESFPGSLTSLVINVNEAMLVLDY